MRTADWDALLREAGRDGMGAPSGQDAQHSQLAQQAQQGGHASPAGDLGSGACGRATPGSEDDRCSSAANLLKAVMSNAASEWAKLGGTLSGLDWDSLLADGGPLGNGQVGGQLTRKNLEFRRPA